MPALKSLVVAFHVDTFDRDSRYPTPARESDQDGHRNIR
jgi:hypothetical protein